MQRLSWLIAPPFDSVTFALRLCLAEALALYLSMWLQLDRPYWASLEVAVMIQPMPGMAVVRGFARASGTLVAGAAGLLIVALFQQSYSYRRPLWQSGSHSAPLALICCVIICPTALPSPASSPGSA